MPPEHLGVSSARLMTSSTNSEMPSHRGAHPCTIVGHWRFLGPLLTVSETAILRALVLAITRVGNYPHSLCDTGDASQRTKLSQRSNQQNSRRGSRTRTLTDRRLASLSDSHEHLSDGLGLRCPRLSRALLRLPVTDTKTIPQTPIGVKTNVTYFLTGTPYSSSAFHLFY